MSGSRLLDRLRARGLLHSVTSPDLEHVLARWPAGATAPCSAYCGFDPTARSLHVGNLVSLVTLRHLQRAGIRPVALVGTATGLIGDPSGKSEERILLARETMAENARGIRRSIEAVLSAPDEAEVEGDDDVADSSPRGPLPAPLVVENGPVYESMSAIDFIRDVGSHFRVSAMLAKDSVKGRMENGAGLSFTEFSYQLLQGWDFHHLALTHGCLVQVGGSDQWGNIVGGVDLIRKLQGREAFGLTVPLLTTASGAKLGKSEGNAVWLNPEDTSHFSFYQYFVRMSDADASRLIRVLTLEPLRTITALETEHAARPEAKTLQRALADAVTRLVRGKEGLLTAQSVTALLYGGAGASPATASAEAVAEIVRALRAGEVPGVSLPATQATSASLTDLSLAVGLATSKADVRRLVTAGGLYVNGRRVAQPTETIAAADWLHGTLAILRSGKAKTFVLHRTTE